MRSKSPKADAARPWEYLVVKGAREHNLAVPELSIPKRSLVVFTGVSGSGKSSLAFDTIYAEGQRRYVESLSSYARQFLGQLERPKVESIKGLSPTIAIEQKSASSNPRSTVGTVTEILDYLRVLWARVGELRCPRCRGPVGGRSAAEVARELAALPEGASVVLLAPKVAERKGEHRELLEELRAAGFVRARVDGEVRPLDGLEALDKKRKHTIEVVVDRLRVGQEGLLERLTDGVETALRAGEGKLVARVEVPGAAPEERLFSEDRACTACGISLPELTPQLLSHNSPLGMCPECSGLGTRLEVDPALVVPDPSKSIEEGAIEPWKSLAEGAGGWTARIADALMKSLGIPAGRPWRKLTERQRKVLLWGADDRIDVAWEGKHSTGSWAMKWEGLCPQLLRRYRTTSSEQMRARWGKYLREGACSACDGTRLRPEARVATLEGRTLVEVLHGTVREALDFFRGLRLEGARAEIAGEVVREVVSRLGFLVDVGLDYLTLGRSATTLSGGEAQRIRLAAQIGSELSGVLYVLDEPSIGLHARDAARLVATLERLRDLGNTVLVVEHDTVAIRAADHVVDFGPGAGRQGGRVVAQGSPAELERTPASLTGRFLAGAERMPERGSARKPKGFLTVKGAREHNLRGVDVRLPLGVFAAVTGVSGAGKSTLVRRILLPALQNRLHGASEPVGAHDGIEGADGIDKIVDIDQRPIGRTPRSNPATYTKAFDLVRDLLAQTAEARASGFGAARFSFNVKGGRCEACEGAGVREVEMHFLPPVHVTCELCRGKRYNDATLRVRYRGKNVAELLETPVAEALEIFAAVPPLARILSTLVDVGLGYVALGQPATTLSGGEAQRIKLARELARRDTGRTLYVLDEPTTGLHFADVRRLLELLRRLVDAGNSVLVIEHNLDVVRFADWVIDMGPEGGRAGGLVVAEGTPEQIARSKRSHTGVALSAG